MIVKMVFSDRLVQVNVFSVYTPHLCKSGEEKDIFWDMAVISNKTKYYTVFQKNPCDYVFDDNLNSKRPIVIIFGTVIT